MIMAEQDRCQLFLIFPEHEDAEKTSSCIKNVSILSPKEVLGYVDLIDTMNRRGRAEHYALYYDSKNIAGFLKPVYELEEYYPSTEVLFYKTLQELAENWREEAIQNQETEYKLFQVMVLDDSFCEVCERKFQNDVAAKDSTFAIINHNAIESIPTEASMSRDGHTMNIPVLNDSVEDIEQWLQHNRRPMRVYHLSSKHGENGKGAHKEHKRDDVAVLYCSKEHAEALLHTALGENNDIGSLYAWDEDCHRYMEFKRESKDSMVFHSYHLEDNDRKIPGIKKILGR